MQTTTTGWGKKIDKSKKTQKKTRMFANTVKPSNINQGQRIVIDIVLVLKQCERGKAGKTTKGKENPSLLRL